jgi:hypothetical protein
VGEVGEAGEDEEPLHSELYCVMYAFNWEGMVEMALAEDKIVCVVGWGREVGWVVVVDEREHGDPKAP